ncbi:MAG: DUF192 domain-containing protein [Bryobacteraceae bacterium]
MGQTRADDKSSQYAVLDLGRGIALARRVRIASDSRARRKGLLGIDRLEPGAGLWIAPCEAVHTIGMKIPIDVVFLGRDHKVKKIVPHLKPWRIAACLAASSVLELEAGAAERAQLRVGARLRFEKA